MFFLKERAGRMLEYIRQQIYPRSREITEYKMTKSRIRYTDIERLDTSRWERFQHGQIWGGHREYYWFETYITVPEEFDGKCVVFELKTGKEGEWDATNPQFTIYVDNVLRQGLDVNHREIVLAEKAEAGRSYRIVLSAFTGDQNFSLKLDSAIKVLDRRTEKYFYDLNVPYQVAALLPENDPAYIAIIQSVNESLNLLDMRQEGSPAYYESLKNAQRYMTDMFYKKYCDERKNPVVYCVGHTHIDCAWLWTLRVTEDKAVRSFSTVLELMKKYPEYKFMSSQPQLYKYVKKNAPGIYRQIRDRIKEGRWEAEGAMFVEADCNLASGESLIRQILYGKRFFRREFGVDNKILWLPDVFGYSAALPQIMQKSGLSYFMTTKISWNETNRMPYDTFEWEGIDGSRVLTHFIPTRELCGTGDDGKYNTDFFTTYNGNVNASQIKGAWERYSQKYLNDEVLCSFGYGDGGGGPTREMLENQRRLARGIPGAPRTELSTAGEFFETLDRNVHEKKKYLPVWVGELYLEYHRGTYTSMARNKKYNRFSEFAFQNEELFAVMDKTLCSGAYPEEQLADGWETILRNQFHDILPGSAIKEVYEDSRAEYEAILDQNRMQVRKSLVHIAEQIDAPKRSLVVFNPNSAGADDLVVIDQADGAESFSVCGGEGKVPVQKTWDNKYIFFARGIPAKGYKTFRAEREEAEKAPRMTATKSGMENDFFKIEYTEKGHFARIYDKRARREILKPGQPGNVIISYEDRPHNYDAWDVNNYYREKAWPIDDVSEMEIIENGPVRSCLKIKRRYLDSVLWQYIYLYRDIPRIDIQNVIDWKEHQIFVKDYFPLDVHANEATYDIQYGNVKRPTHDNTSWDYAKFEVCHHKWVDISEAGYGVSILNDCKYGVSVRDGVVGLSMLKSAVYPNPDADKETHEFVYSIYPHEGGWREAGTIAQAYQVNNHPIGIWKENEGGVLDAEFCFVSADQENAVVEVVKKAEDTDDLIVRVYESFCKRTDVTLTFGRRVSCAAECDMMEEKDTPVSFMGNRVAFTLKPYEIKTLKISLLP